MRARDAAATLLLALALSACGGDDPEPTTSATPPAEAEAAIEEAWETYVDSVKAGNGEAACAVLSEDLARPGEVNFALGEPLPGGPSCEETLSEKDAAVTFTPGFSAELAELSIDGATADAIAGAAKPTFAETDGEWEITSFYGVLPEE